MAKEPEQIKSVEAVFTPSETDHILRCVDLAIKSYQRSQTQRPEFKETAERIHSELQQIKFKILSLPKHKV